MGIDKYGDKAIEKLRQAGKATLVFTVEIYPGDKKFKPEPPSIDLYIVPRRDNEDAPPEELPVDCYKGIISINTEKNERMFEMQVESITGIFSRMWYNLTKAGKKNNGSARKKKRAEPKEVWIIAEPHNHWKKSYQRTFYSKKLNAGPPIPLTVSLKPTENANDSDA